MKTLIAFASAHGCTETCAISLKGQLSGEIDLFDLKDKNRPELQSYDTIIIGGSIHAGKIQGYVKRFCERNQQVLLSKKLGLFLCCMEEGDTAMKQFNNAYPENLIEHATATGLFGGAFDFDKMNAITKAIIKKIAKVDKNISKIKDKNVAAFADQMK